MDDPNFNAEQIQILKEMVSELYRLSDTLLSMEEICQGEILDTHNQSRTVSDALLKKIQDVATGKKLP